MYVQHYPRESSRLHSSLRLRRSCPVHHPATMVRKKSYASLLLIPNLSHALPCSKRRPSCQVHQLAAAVKQKVCVEYLKEPLPLFLFLFATNSETLTTFVLHSALHAGADDPVLHAPLPVRVSYLFRLGCHYFGVGFNFRRALPISLTSAALCS